MNYSTALLESIEAAQILAGHYQGNTLDTWHLLTAMANNPCSGAYYRPGFSKRQSV